MAAASQVPMEHLNPVAVMDELVYNSLIKYFNTLEKTGYMADSNTAKLLVLAFYKDFVYDDYRGLIDNEDYHLIERALDCIYGTSCLTPYPDYLKMGKLNLGQVSELACRVRTLEEEPVLKLLRDGSGEEIQSDVLIVSDDEE